jgi:hypothetical protein
MNLYQSTKLFLALAGFMFLAGGLQSSFGNSTIEEKVVQVGKEVAAELMRNLKKALTEAMHKGGPTAAIQVCKREASLLTQSTSSDYPDIRVRRTSLKFRNPKNRPDSCDQAVLAELARLKNGGDPLPDHTIRKSAAEGTAVYRFYQPIVVSGFCLNCHGSSNTMSPDVIKVLEREYPEDRAVDYVSGDLRGVISVEIPERTLVHK